MALDRKSYDEIAPVEIWWQILAYIDHDLSELAKRIPADAEHFFDLNILDKYYQALNDHMQAIETMGKLSLVCSGFKSLAEHDLSNWPAVKKTEPTIMRMVNYLEKTDSRFCLKFKSLSDRQEIDRFNLLYRIYPSGDGNSLNTLAMRGFSCTLTKRQTCLFFAGIEKIKKQESLTHGEISKFLEGMMKCPDMTAMRMLLHLFACLEKLGSDYSLAITSKTKAVKCIVS
jgi:hypothetical protein